MRSIGYRRRDQLSPEGAKAIQVPQYDARFCGSSGIVVQTPFNLLPIHLRSLGQHRQDLCGLANRGLGI